MKKWTHPKTNETRIYLNHSLGFDVKIWVEAVAISNPLECDWQIRSRQDSPRVSRERIEDTAYSILGNALGIDFTNTEKNPTFADLVAKAI